ncbi:MAG: sigma-70 family RNA polymerase sigma factor, partial [Myxococcales bacterium]|nr:sigma-70 family RNA polymerase sigma factor [Myxococcales bacterium]
MRRPKPPSPPSPAESRPPQPGCDPVGPAYRSLRDGLRQFMRNRVGEEHADDLVQDVFLRMHEHADGLRDEDRVAAWAFRIARNVVIDHYRSRPRRSLEPLPGDASFADLASLEPTGNQNEIVAGWLRPMLFLLPDIYAEAVEAVELEGLTHKEYAERAGISLSGAKSRTQRARAMLE